MAVAEKLSTLSVSDIKKNMESLPQWSLQDRSIVREFSFKDFRHAIDFVTRLARVAEAMDHHPDITILYNKVKLELSTHKAGGLTQKDFDLALKTDHLI